MAHSRASTKSETARESTTGESLKFLCHRCNAVDFLPPKRPTHETRNRLHAGGIGDRRFTLNREPDNKRAQEMLDQLTGQDSNNAYVSTLELERQINTFFRLTSPTVIARIRDAFPELGEQPDARTVFLNLRELRNSW